MILIEHDVSPAVCRYILRPNQSISWPQLKRVFAGLCLFSLSIASAMALMGYWPVLPFAGLEMLAVGSALYLVARRGYRREVITIGDEQVRIERGRYAPEHGCSLARHWASVALEKPPERWYASRLLIRSQGRAVEVGSFLTEPERRQLAAELRRGLRSDASSPRIDHRPHRQTPNHQHD